MIALNAAELNNLFPRQAVLRHADFNIKSVVIDSRKECRGALFVAIRGDQHDGHQYVDMAAGKGAVAALVETEVQADIAQIIVEDTRLALGQLAQYWRKKTAPLVIAITGSNGKTTVKEMLGRILSAHDRTLMTPGNFNNDIGVPLTLFSLDEKDRFAVIEMGANHAGEIRQLLQIAEPDVVYVNNAHAAHIEGFGSLDGVIESKGEMYRYCSPRAVAVFNEDEPACEYWKSIAVSHLKLGFSSRDEDAGLFGCSVALPGGMKLDLHQAGQQEHCELAVYGKHNAQNALAALTLATACGLDLHQASTALDGFTGVRGRQQFFHGRNDSVIINDSYNANPDSLQVAIDVLCGLPGEAWLALGDMNELGDAAQTLHEMAVRQAHDAGVQRFFALGEMSCRAIKPYSNSDCCFASHETMAVSIGGQLRKGVNLLVKGSHSAGMEKVVELLITKKDHPDEGGVHHAV